MYIRISALNASHAKQIAKLDDHLGPDIVITKVKTLRRANTHGWKEGIYEIRYHKKGFK